MKFKKEYMQELATGDRETIVDKLVDHTRWSLIYELVFEFEGKFYSSSYCRGATEYQDESPYEFDEDEIECEEVYPVQELITIYKTKKELEEK